MNRNQDSTFTLRMPSTMVKKIDEAARQSQRSRSAEIRYRLEQSLDKTRRTRAAAHT